MSGEPFASLDELQARLDFTLDGEEIKAAESALVDASDMARYYGAAWPDPDLAPPIVKVCVLNACRRFLKLIDGFTLSRAGDETVQWTDMKEKTGTVFFTPEEQAQLRSAAGRDRRFWSVGVFAWDGTRRAGRDGLPAGYVATEGTAEPFMVDYPSSVESRPGVVR